MTNIGDGAFSHCISLSSIEIPNSVTNIGERAFYGAILKIAVPTGREKVQEIELPDIIKRAMIEGDLLYTDKEVTLTNCSINDEKTRLCVNVEDIGNKTASLNINSGLLNGLKVEVVLSGTITYNTTDLTNKNVIANLHIAEGEKVTNNDGNMTKKFEENGEFTYTYTTIDGEEKKAIAKVNWIDKTVPLIELTENETTWTKDGETIWTKNNVIIRARDELSELKELTVNGTEVQITKGEATYTATENGTYKIIAIDKFGNTATKNYTVKIDKTAPTNTKPIVEIIDNTIKVTLAQIDELSGINSSTAQYAIKKTSDSSWGSWISSNTGSYTFENLEDREEYQIKTRVKDNVGNGYTESEVLTVHIGKKGDINGDGKINIQDLILIKRHIVAGEKTEWKLTTKRQELADINRDGRVNIQDIVLIKKDILGIQKID